MGARILVIEDNRTNLDLMVYLLRAFGHEPKGVTDGVRGLEDAAGGGYDLVLSDVLMPGIDGYELARRYKADARLRTVPLVAVTALAMAGDREKLLASGFDGYIAKPIDPESFVAQVEKYLPAAARSVLSAGKATATSEPAARRTGSGPVILAVDDIAINIDVISGTLEPFGYRVVHAGSVREALAKVHELRPSLILCDVHMPDGDGFDLLREVKSSTDLQDVPFIFLSSTAWRTSDQIRGLQLGANKFLLRPIDPDRLREEVESALAVAIRGDDPDR